LAENLSERSVPSRVTRERAGASSPERSDETRARCEARARTGHHSHEASAARAASSPTDRPEQTRGHDPIRQWISVQGVRDYLLSSTTHQANTGTDNAVGSNGCSAT